MTRREAERLTRQADTLRGLGFTQEEAEQLRRISMTLHRWHELECGTDSGAIERDETTGKAYRLNSHTMRRTPVADREKGALKRLKTIIADRNNREIGKVMTDQVEEIETVQAYVQGDPRGAALYILRPGDVPQGADVSAYYSRGICIY